jgi:hypothetical protein
MEHEWLVPGVLVPQAAAGTGPQGRMQMRQDSTRALHAYWTTLRGARPMPERDEIEPSAIRALLQDMFILGRDGDPSGRAIWRYRLAGTRVSALAGRDLKGVPFFSWWDSGREGERLATGVANDMMPLVAGIDGEGLDGARHGLELLMLPLAHEGRTGGRVIGGFFPTPALRAKPGTRLGSITLISARTLLPGSNAMRREGDFGVTRADDAVAARTRARFRVIEGGKVS